MGAEISDATGLSVERVFLILEELTKQGEPRTLTELAQGLDLPKSSLLKLLRGLTSLGYLNEDLAAKSYFPSLSVSNLGRRIETMLIGHSDHIAMLEQLRETTRESVGLATRHGDSVQFHCCLASPQPLGFNLVEGARYPIHMAAAGRALIAGMTFREREKLIARLAKKDLPEDQRIEADELNRFVKSIRSNGYAMSDPRIAPNVLSIAIKLPEAASAAPIALSIGGPAQRIKRAKNDIIAALKDTISNYYLDP